MEKPAKIKLFRRKVAITPTGEWIDVTENEEVKIVDPDIEREAANLNSIADWENQLPRIASKIAIKNTEAKSMIESFGPGEYFLLEYMITTD